MDQAPADAKPGARRELKRGLSARTLDASSEYKLLVVLELADRNLKHTIDHECVCDFGPGVVRLCEHNRLRTLHTGALAVDYSVQRGGVM